MKKVGLISIALLGLVCPAQAQSGDEVRPVLLGTDPVLPAFTPQTVRPGRDRFSNTPALTLDDLVNTLKTNKTFRTNLARHFAIPDDRLIEFVQDALVPQYLTADTRVPNFGVTKSGTIYSKTTTLKKGTRVWATRDGKPILKWDCSNPITKTPPVVRRRPSPAPSAISRESRVLTPEASLLAPTELEAPVGITLAMDVPFDPIVPPTEKTIVPDPTPGPPPTTNRTITAVTRSGIPLLPVAGVFGLTVRSRTTGGNVPEPATLALVGLGALGLALTRRRR